MDINITNIISKDLMELVNQAELLSKKYSAVVTNPPYMNKFEKSLKDFAKKYYKDYSKDLFSMFIYRNFKFSNENGYCGFITPFNWMFIKNYNKLREYIVKNKWISSLIQLEYNAFTEIAMVPVGTFILTNSALNLDYNGIYFRLSEFKGDMETQKEKVLEGIKTDANYTFISGTRKFINIPGNIISYWVSNEFLDNFNKGYRINEISDFTGSQNKTANNKKYLRYFWEVDYNQINKKWFVYAKGGKFRKYYGNLNIVVDWSEEARTFYKTNKTSNLLDENYWYQEGITYNDIASSGTGFRYLPENCIFDMSGPSIVRVKHLLYCLGFLNSKVAFEYLKFLAPTLHIKVYNMNSIPIIIDESYYTAINEITLENINISKKEWDTHETSLNFKHHPFLSIETSLIENAFNNYSKISKKEFIKQKENEEKLNEIFMDIYNLNKVLETNVTDKEITLTLPNYKKCTESFISYAVGCMFGRYSLDNDGIQFAGGEFNINNYDKFIPDDDNIIPILDSEYFEDDIVGKFIEFVKICFGEEHLEKNLDFIANALSSTTNSSRTIIRNYFINNLFKNHLIIYKNCPVYWQFSSGKENSFNCLVYMHRYEPSLVARIRTDYLHKTQKAIEQRIANNDNIINNSTSKQDVANATKEKTKLQKQLKETQEYDEVLAHVANQNIEIDLDDGVKVNYAKFQNIEIKKEGSKTKKVNLLKKI